MLTRLASVPRALVAALAFGLALRLAAMAIPSVMHPDEIYQYLEAAHRQLFGYGVIPWEYRVGMRSWVLPMLLAGPMALGDMLAPGTGLYLALPRLATVLASATIILSAWSLGDRISRRHAVAAAWVAACWYELVAAAPHPIGEVTSLAAAAGAAALLFGGHRRLSSDIAAGLLLALALVLRFQTAPALATLALFAGGRDIRRWLAMIAGGMMVLSTSALVDIGHGASPFAWIVENFRQNIVLNKAAQFGTAGPAAYLGVMLTMWRWAMVPIVIAAYVGAKRQPALFWAAIAHLLLHSLIAHKEYRFILLSDAFLIILAAIGSVDIFDSQIARRRLSRSVATAIATVVAVAWLSTSAALAALPWNRPMWTAHAVAMQDFASLRRDPALCGIGILGVPVSEFGGYVGLHRNVPIYILDATFPHQRAVAASWAGAFNRIVVTSYRANDVPAGFSRQRCTSTAGEYIGNYTNPQDARSMAEFCIYARRGACEPAVQELAEPLTVNPFLARIGM